MTTDVEFYQEAVRRKVALSHENHHLVALAREWTFAAGCPLRDRYGFAADDQDVLNVINIVYREPDDDRAAAAIGIGNFNGDHQIAMATDTPSDEDYDRRIVTAIRPLVEQRMRFR